MNRERKPFQNPFQNGKRKSKVLKGEGKQKRTEDICAFKRKMFSYGR
jgi:hypothetical protein